MSFNTNTSNWSLVVQRVTATSVEIWVGTLFPTLKKPSMAKILLKDSQGNTVSETRIPPSEWLRPFRNMNQRFYYVKTFVDLDPNAYYEVEFLRETVPINGVMPNGAGSWQCLRAGKFTTLPQSLPSSGDKPFTVAIGSCFYPHKDGGQAAEAFRAHYLHGEPHERPDVVMLTGDQVYLDIGFDSLSFIPSEIRQRIADDYARNWQELGSIFSHGATWMLPDDHEYWNDYPFYKTPIPQLLALRIDTVRNAWTRAAQDGVNRVQRSQPFESFDIGSEISFCLFDTRSLRHENGFTNKKQLKKVLQWARGLKCPGVLVCSQPLIVEHNKTEKNLLSYTGQYSELLKALAHSGHDIVLLSGDVHFGRISSVPLGSHPNQPKLIEVISSPMSNLTYLNGIATDTPKTTPKKFPDQHIAQQLGWKREDVTYGSQFQVKTEEGSIFSAYPKDRTREHYMTVGFSRTDQDQIQLQVKSWQVRYQEKPMQLPKPGLQEPFSYLLK